MKAVFHPEWPLANLKPADYNPRVITAEAFQKLQESLKRFGCVKPVILNQDGTLVAGHQRTKALRAIGATHVPAMVLPNQVGRQDEIRFNLIHNSIETDLAEGRIEGELPLGYSIVAPDRLNLKLGEHGSGSVAKEIGRLIVQHGTWGSVIVSESGLIIGNADYALVCQSMRLPVLAYALPDSEVPALLAAMRVDYGEYHYQALEVPGYNQFHAQLNRLRGRRDDDGNLADGSTDLASHIYTKLIEPLLAGLAEKPRIVDFGAGNGDHAKQLKERGYPIFTYEPHLRIPGREAFDVRGIAASVQRLGRSVARDGLFPIVVLDSVLNSVISPEFEDAVMVCVNALCAKDGVLFTNGRSLEQAQSDARRKRSTGSERRIEFLDANNFSATYRSGRWTLQHFHSKEQIAALARNYFGHVEPRGSDNYHRIECRDPLPLGEERYRAALDMELNMELPGPLFHGKHRQAVDAITAAALARDGQ